MPRRTGARLARRTATRSVSDFVMAAKANGGDWIIAGTGKGEEDHLLASVFTLFDAFCHRYEGPR